MAFFKYLVQARLYITLSEGGYFLPGAPVAGDGAEAGGRTGNGKGPRGAGRAPGRTVAKNEEKSSEGEHKGNRVKGRRGGLGLR